MMQTKMPIFGEDVAWMLLQVTGTAVLCLAVRIFVNQYRLSLLHLKGPSGNQTVSLWELMIPVSCLFN